MPKAFKSWPKSNKSPNLVTLVRTLQIIHLNVLHHLTIKDTLIPRLCFCSKCYQQQFCLTWNLINSLNVFFYFFFFHWTDLIWEFFVRINRFKSDEKFKLFDVNQSVNDELSCCVQKLFQKRNVLAYRFICIRSLNKQEVIKSLEIYINRLLLVFSLTFYVRSRLIKVYLLRKMT